MEARMNKEKLIAQLRVHEGVEHTVYNDTMGIPTIGVGRNLRDKGLSDQEIDYLLSNDIDAFAEEVATAFPWWETLDEVRQRVMVDMAFNMGTRGLSNFKITLGHIEAGRFGEAAEEMLNSRWARQVGNRSQVLSEMMKTGDDHGY